MKVSGRMKVKSLKEEFKKEFGVSVRVYKGKQFADDDASLASIRAEGAPAKGDFEVRGNTKVGNVEKQFKDQLGITIQIENSSGELADNGVTLGSLKAGSTDKKKADKDNTPEKEKTVKPEKTKSEKLENIDFSSTLIALETKLKEAPDLIKYAEPLASQLAKYNLQNENAKVALVMDISGSMENSYKNGTVQEIINKIVPLSLQLNNNGTLDLWYYGNRYKKMNDVTLSNYRNAVPNDWESLMRSLGYTTDLASVMEDIINFFRQLHF